MPRTQLIRTYSRLNTNDLPGRIYRVLKDYIENENIDQLPECHVLGRHTGKIAIINGYFHNTYDLSVQALDLCRIDRDGNLTPNLPKIKAYVNSWRKSLMTPTSEDEAMGVDDYTFESSAFFSDEVHEFMSKAYTAENLSFIKRGGSDTALHDRTLTEIDRECGIEGVNIHILNIHNPKTYRQMVEAMDNAGAMLQGGIEGLGSKEELEKRYNELKELPSLSEYMDMHADGDFGDLPAYYDGLANPGEPGYKTIESRPNIKPTRTDLFATMTMGQKIRKRMSRWQ